LSQPSAKYRPDVDGLRAIAVMLVIVGKLLLTLARYVLGVSP
jgi:peptidoglycan/LPS O-acetylase OafA/YrhL